MPETKLRELYMASGVNELDQHYDVSQQKGRNFKLLCNSARKIFDKAEDERKNGDEELSYVMYMKYIAVIDLMIKTPDCDKAFMTSILGRHTPNVALERASTLKNSLISRYKKKQTNMLNQYNKKFGKKPSQDLNMEVSINENSPDSMINDPPHFDSAAVPDEFETSLTSTKLVTLIKSNPDKILILDTRSRNDFTLSHIKFPQCINIPEEIILPGITANKLEKNLPQESIALWSQRAEKEHIILLDWSSETLISGKIVYLLKTILMKWDPQIVYKRPPVFLKGGYEDWLLTYPTYTTNPKVSPPCNQSAFDDLLYTIEYPQLLETATKDITKSSTIVTSESKNPGVDRSSKAAAVQTYEERAKEVNKILEEQEKLAGHSLDIEKQRVLAEQNWEILQQNKKTENEEETSILREQELLSEIMQLESFQRDMTLENQQLREQLEEYKRKEREESTKPLPTSSSIDKRESPPIPKLLSNGSLNDINVLQNETLNINEHNYTKTKTWKSDPEALAKEEKIKNMEEERAALERKREMMQSDREKILADAREKKKLLYNKEFESDAFNDGTANKSYSPPIKKVTTDQKLTPDIPQINRNTKPSPSISTFMDYNQNKQRDFQGVWGNQGQGLTGLKNLGNTCYMNSVLQCLNNTTSLVKYFRDGLYRDHLRHSSHDFNNGGTQGAVAEEVAAVVQALWSGQYRFISPKDLRNVIGRYRSMFRGVEQQDSHEFLTILMDWLHNDLQIAVDENIQTDNLSPADKAWVEYTKSKESLISKLFYGQIKSTVKCSVCGEESVTYDSFSNLSLELPANVNRCSLNDCLKLYLNYEKIVGWNCPACKEKRDAHKKLDISKLPPVLVIHFKRFYVDQKDYISNSCKKKQTYIDFPIENLNLNNIALQSNKNKVYNLYGVSNHYGSMESGHCTAFCKSSAHSKWFKFDDHTVTEISPSDVVSSAAYILFYTSLSHRALQ